MRIIELQNAGSKRAFQDQTITQILSEVNTYFAEESTCSEAMLSGGAVDLSDDVSREIIIYSRPGKDRFRAGTKIEQVKILSITARANDSTTFGEKTVFDVWLKFHRTGKNETTTVKRLKVIGKVNEDGVVENCESYDNTAAVEMRRMICEDDLGGTLNNNGKCVHSSGTEGNILKETACEMLGGSFNIATGRCEVMEVDKYSFLGKARADRNSTCTSEEKAAVRFNLNPDVDTLEVCNGSNWGTFGAKGAVANELVPFTNKKYDCAGMVEQMNGLAGNKVGIGFQVINESMYFSQKGNWLLIVGKNECSDLNNRPETAYGYIPRDSYGDAVLNYYHIVKVK